MIKRVIKPIIDPVSRSIDADNISKLIHLITKQNIESWLNGNAVKAVL